VKTSGRSIVTRRDALRIGGGLLLAGPLSVRPAAAAEPVEIVMRGDADGATVWFDPIGMLVQPGQTIRWTNRDPGNSHTATAYHPDNAGHARRIPDGAEPWHSGYLLPDETFAVTLTVEGVYDYFCVPHEHAGMVGRIVVGRPTGPQPSGESARPIPDVAQRAFPAIEDILRRGAVRRS